MTTHRHTAHRKTGRRAGGRKNNALAHSIPQASLSRAALLHCRARGSSFAPTGRHSFKEKCLSYKPEAIAANDWLAAFELVLPGVSIPYNGIQRVKNILIACQEWGVKANDSRLSVKSGFDYRKPPQGERVVKIGANTISKWKSETFWLVMA